MFEKWLNKILSKKGDSPDERAHLIRLAGLAGIIANSLFAGVKLLVGLSANSIAIVSDAVNNLADALSSVITLVGLKISRHHPDYKHPLGYGRIEYISGMIISALVLGTGVEFLISSAKRIGTPEASAFSGYQFLLLAVVIVGKWMLSRLDLAVGKRTNSTSLIAAGVDAKMDVLVSLMTVTAGLISMGTGWYLDGYVGVLLSLFIIYSGAALIRETVSSIIGERPDKALVESIKAEVVKHEPIVGAYDLILHSYGPATRLCSLNLEIPDYVTVERTYEAMTAARQDIYNVHGIHITFGLYSVNTYDKEITAMRADIERIVTSLPNALSIHNFYYDKQQKLIRLDAVVGFATRDLSAFRTLATDAIHQKYADATVVMNVELDYA